MKSTMITTVGRHTIVKLEKADRVEWVVCRGYEESRPEGQKWDSGIYFSSLDDAVSYAYGHDTMYLVTMHDDLACNPNVYAVVRTKEDAYDKIKDFMANQRMNEELNWKELKDFDYTHVGENGFFEIKEYILGDDIVEEE